MSNLHRAEVALELGGRRYRLRLTLQALAEIEAALAVDGLGALGARLSGGRLGTGDLIRLAGALIRGGGEALSDAALASELEARDLPAIVAAVSAIFAASFPAEEGPPAGP